MNRQIATVIAVIIFVVALVRPFNGSIRAQALVLFEMGIFAAMASYLFFRVNRWIAVFLLLALVSRHFPNQVNTVSLEASRWVLFGCVWYALVYNHPPKQFLDVLCIIAVVNAVVILLQWVGVNGMWVFVTESKGYPGLMANPNETAAVFAMAVPAFFRPKRWPWLILVILSWIPAKSVMAAVISLAMGTGYALVMVGASPKVLAAVCALLLGVVVAYAVLVRFPAYEHRLSFPAEVGSKLKTSALITGIGVGNWKVLYLNELRRGNISSGRIRMHNTLIQGWVEMGVGFLLIIGGYLLTLSRRITNRGEWLYAMALIGIFVCANVNSMMRMNAVTAMLVIAWLAVMDRKCGYIT